MNRTPYNREALMGSKAMSKGNGIATGRYVFPTLPEGHSWRIERPMGLVSFLKISIIRKGRFFTRTVNSRNLYFFYAETEEGMKPYEPGSTIELNATQLRFDTFPYEYEDATSGLYYISELRKGEGTEKILDAVYTANHGIHQGGDAIYHSEEA